LASDVLLIFSRNEKINLSRQQQIKLCHRIKKNSAKKSNHKSHVNKLL
jgi:hypothetical protein